jgi:spore coat polysaccharide biosynthesis predicted glycosyltransferase SpsG
VLGNASPNLVAVRRWIESWGHEACLIVDSDDMPGLLRSADLVLGAGGVSLYERMACGVPSVTVQLAENQAANIALGARHGATLSAGPIEAVTAESLAAIVLSLARSPEDRASQSRCGQTWVDGRGPLRVAEEMMRLVDGAAQARSSVAG